MKKIILMLPLIWCSVSFATSKSELVLSDLEFFQKTGIEILKKHPRLPMAIGRIPAGQEERVHTKVHELGRCGGYELISDSVDLNIELGDLERTLQADQKFSLQQNKLVIPKNTVFASKAELVSSANLKRWVEWMQAFGTRYHKASNPNTPVVALEQEIRTLLKGATVPYEVELISHSRTQQKSVRVRLPGKTNKDQIIILGAHFDSIAGWGFGAAPGADDNASGSSNLLEVLRILSVSSQMNRTLEFYWYAGEEGGLIGSSEIARTYKEQGQQVVAAMQLDMTLFPGDGPFKLGSVTDFTTPWVRQFLNALNASYFQYEISEFACGYGCSDHASWYRNGFSAVAPFEARMETMNRDIHTARDQIKPSYNFEHSAAFSKLALVFALELDTYTPPIL